jgi:hypothetical protein
MVCLDVVHSVETYHNGPRDSAGTQPLSIPSTLAQPFYELVLRQTVMYIPAVPLTQLNLKYIICQHEHFLTGMPAPDFPQDNSHGREANFVNKGLLEHLGTDPISLHSMGFGDVPFPLDDGNAEVSSVRAMRELANQMLYTDTGTRNQK